jgi:anti-sigma factor RsiW
MKNPELDQAIQDTLDGVATPAQREWLKHRLESDPAARAEYERRQALFTSLAPRPMVEPPADLAASVMSAIRNAPRHAPARRNAFSAVREAFARRPALVGAWSFAMGCLIGALLMFAGSRAPWNPASRPLPVSATMGLAHRDGATTDRASWRAGHADGVIEIERFQDLASAHVLVRSDAPANVVLEFDPLAMSAAGADWNDRASRDLEIEAAGRIRFASAGITELVVRFRCADGADAALKISVDCGGATSTAVVHGGTGATPGNEPKSSVH